MTRTVRAERFSLAETWQIACKYADGDRSEVVKSKWTSLLKRYPEVSMRLYNLAMIPQAREFADILLYIPFGISPRIIGGMIKVNMTGVEKPAPGVKVPKDDDEDAELEQPVKVKKVTQEVPVRKTEEEDIAAMLRDMEQV